MDHQHFPSCNLLTSLRTWLFAAWHKANSTNTGLNCNMWKLQTLWRGNCQSVWHKQKRSLPQSRDLRLCKRMTRLICLSNPTVKCVLLQTSVLICSISQHTSTYDFPFSPNQILSEQALMNGKSNKSYFHSLRFTDFRKERNFRPYSYVRNGGTDSDRRQPKYSERNLSQCHFFDHISDKDWPKFEFGP